MAQKYPSDFNRRHFLTGLGITTASATISPAEATEVAFLVIGRADDSGNLKGFLRKAGR
jgi:hypothetical protein